LTSIVRQVCGVESGQLGLLSKDFSVIQEAAIMALRLAFIYRQPAAAKHRWLLPPSPPAARSVTKNHRKQIR
jgi:hypothetical protein